MENGAHRLAAVVSWGFAGSTAIEVVLVYLTRALHLTGSLHGHGDTAWGRWVQWVLRLLAVTGLFLPPAALVACALVSRRLFGTGLAPAIVAGLMAAVAVAWLARYVGDHRTLLPFRDVGTAKQLRGDCAVFHVFLGSDWTAEQKMESLQCAREACDWLEAEAADRGVEVRLNRGDPELYLLPGWPATPDELRRSDSRGSSGGKMDLLLNTIRAARPEAWREASARLDRLPARPENTALLMHVPGRLGFAIPTQNSLWSNPAPELCVCGSENPPSTFAHELLHLFGAQDLYLDRERVLTRPADEQTTDADFERRIADRVSAEFTGGADHSIMAETARPLARLRIDSITAAAVGWPVERKALRRALRTWEQQLTEQVVAAVLAVGSEVTAAERPNS